MTVVAMGAGGAGVVLGAAGVTKLVDPSPTERLLAALGLGGGAPVARAAGLVELGLALWLLASGAPASAAGMAAAYLVLLITVLVLRHRSPSTPCGCFGQWSGPPSARHVIVNALGVSVCALAAATATPVAPPSGVSATGALGWWGAVAGVAIAGVIALGGRGENTGVDAVHTGATGRRGDADGRSRGHSEAQR